jgi:hypothetical protein
MGYLIGCASLAVVVLVVALAVLAELLHEKRSESLPD